MYWRYLRVAFFFTASTCSRSSTLFPAVESKAESPSSPHGLGPHPLPLGPPRRQTPRGLRLVSTRPAAATAGGGAAGQHPRWGAHRWGAPMGGGTWVVDHAAKRHRPRPLRPSRRRSGLTAAAATAAGAGHHETVVSAADQARRPRHRSLADAVDSRHHCRHHRRRSAVVVDRRRRRSRRDVHRHHVAPSFLFFSSL